MPQPKHLIVLAAFLLSFASLVCAAPSPPGGGVDDKDAPSARPRPDLPKKIYTNDDFQHLAAPPVAAETVAPAETPSEPAAPARLTRTRVAPYIPEKDPAWYAEQVNTLNHELERTEGDADYLRQFWNNGYAPQTGLILNAPCEGIGTFNRIDQLDDRRREILAQIDSLEDTARRNGLPPGIFEHAAEIAASSRPRMSIAAQRAALREQLDEADEELAQTQGTVAEMRADTSARNMTLLQPEGVGASFTTDLLDRLNKRAADLESQISALQDEARAIGATP